MPYWRLVTDSSPAASDLPCTVVQSKDRDRAVWTSYIEHLSESDKKSVAPFFDDGENVHSEDWFPPLC